uniref:Uncharacterized protein n=1 Tax=Catagonus wagneri TaxID=51154 RepID=A0A8C3VLV8_9CETA
AVKEEVQRLRSRVDTLEQKLQLVLAPLHSLASRALEHGLPDPGSLLAHSLQQLDRIDSLSEQISFLEEQLGSCECPAPRDPERPWSPGPVPAQRPEREVGQPRVGTVTSDPASSHPPTGSCKKEL